MQQSPKQQACLQSERAITFDSISRAGPPAVPVRSLGERASERGGERSGGARRASSERTHAMPAWRDDEGARANERRPCPVPPPVGVAALADPGVQPRCRLHWPHWALCLAARQRLRWLGWRHAAGAAAARPDPSRRTWWLQTASSLWMRLRHWPRSQTRWRGCTATTAPRGRSRWPTVRLGYRTIRQRKRPSRRKRHCGSKPSGAPTGETCAAVSWSMRKLRMPAFASQDHAEF